MSKRDYYEVLGVDKGANKQELKKAYRRVAMKFHPDRNPDNEEAEAKFKEANEAYEVLSNEDKRAAYDRFGHAGVDGQAGGGYGGGGPEGFSDIFGDVFGDIFGGGGGGGRQRGPARGSDLKYNLEIELGQAVTGTTVSIDIPKLDSCDVCDGSGAAAGSTPTTCNTCGGVGQVRMQQGFFAVQQTCPTCHGNGRIISNPCRPCRGQGRVERTKTLSVKIPEGVDTGDRIRLTGEGEASANGGLPGDLYVEVHIKKHAIFERDGKNLYCDVPISFTKATLGGQLEVPTLEGRINLRIPAETQTGKMFRVPGRGVKPVRGGAKGDLLCRVVIETPVKLNSKQKKLLEEFEGSLSEKHSPKSGTWFDGVKRFFDDMKY